MAGNPSAASEPHGPPPALKPSRDSQSAETVLCVSPAPNKLPALHPTLGGANLARGPAFSFPCVPRPGSVGQSSRLSFASVPCLLLSRLGLPFPRVANAGSQSALPPPFPLPRAGKSCQWELCRLLASSATCPHVFLLSAFPCFPRWGAQLCCNDSPILQ